MKKKHIYLILCFFWMLLIFLFSAQPSNESQANSNQIIEMIEHIFNVNVIQEGGWLFDSMSFIIRKAAHMSEYAILGIFLSLYARELKIPHAQMIAFLILFLYASSDEFHQLFVPGRSGQFQDVLIDASGGAIGIFMLRFWYFIKHQCSLKKHKRTLS